MKNGASAMSFETLFIAFIENILFTRASGDH